MSLDQVPKKHKIFRWILDVTELWHSDTDSSHKETSMCKWLQRSGTRYALKFLSQTEQLRVKRKRHINDAKLSLASALMKRAAVCQQTDSRWDEVEIYLDEYQKPCHRPSSSVDPTIRFNISHHGSLVVLIGCAADQVQLGVDLVQIDHEYNNAQFARSGFPDFMMSFENVFDQQELQSIMQCSHLPLMQLRGFFSHWALKEAYLKMTGLAFCDPSPKETEIRSVTLPAQMPIGTWGESNRFCEVWRSGHWLETVTVELQAYQHDYIVATCVSSRNVEIEDFQTLDLDRDIYSYALATTP